MSRHVVLGYKLLPSRTQVLSRFTYPPRDARGDEVPAEEGEEVDLQPAPHDDEDSGCEEEIKQTHKGKALPRTRV